MRARTFIALFASLVFLTGVAEAVNVSGTLNTTTWSKANSPYRVTGTVTVPTGNTLTIEPGVDVVFDAGDCMGLETTATKAGHRREILALRDRELSRCVVFGRV